MVGYADTSFLFSLYAQDANTERATTLGSALGESIIFTPLQKHELRNAFRLAVFRNDMTRDDCQAVLETVEADVRTGTLVETPVAWAEVYSQAEALSAAHTETLGTRASDVLHVASAAALGAKAFYTFDTRQRSLAKKAGMTVNP